MKLRTLIFTALLALGGLGLAAASFGATPPPAASTGAGPGGKHEGYCQANAQACKDGAARFDTWCSANAEKCMGLKAWADKRIEFCKANAQKCEEHRARMRERMEQQCDQDPSKAHCDSMRKQPGGDEEQSDDQAPPPPPAF